jgi:hypothetical protein
MVDTERNYHLLTDSRHLFQWQVGTSFRAPYQALAEILGGPGDTQLDIGNYHTAWLIADSARDELTFFIHDSRGDGTQDENRGASVYEWHIHGPDERTLSGFCRWLSERVIARHRARPAPRRITARSREHINELMRGGMSASEAMSSSAEWEPTPDAADLAWPIPGRAAIEGLSD